MAARHRKTLVVCPACHEGIHTGSPPRQPRHAPTGLLVADQPGNLTVSVRLSEGLSERRDTKAVTAVEIPAAAVPPVTPRLFLQDWPLVVVAVLIVGFAAALVALVTPVGALLAVVATARRSGGGGSGETTARSGQQQPRHGPAAALCNWSAGRC
jgi:hypothetical protein